MPTPRGVACPGAVAILAVAAALAVLPAAARAGTPGQWGSGFGFDLPSAVSTAGDGHGAAIAAWTTRDGVLRLAIRPSRTAAWSAARGVAGPAFGPDVAIGAGRRAVAVWDAGGAVSAVAWTPATRLAPRPPPRGARPALRGRCRRAREPRRSLGSAGDVHARVLAAGAAPGAPTRGPARRRRRPDGRAPAARRRGGLVVANNGLGRRVAATSAVGPLRPAGERRDGLRAAPRRRHDPAPARRRSPRPRGGRPTAGRRRARPVIPAGAPASAVATSTRAVVAWETGAPTPQGLRQQVYAMVHDAAGWHPPRRVFGRPASSAAGTVRLFADEDGDIAALAAVIDARQARCCFGRSVGNADLVAIMLPAGRGNWTAATTLGTSVFLDQFPPNPPFTSDEWHAGPSVSGFVVGFGQDGMRVRDLAPQGLRRDPILGAHAPNLGWRFRYELHPSELRRGTPVWTFGDGSPRALRPRRPAPLLAPRHLHHPRQRPRRQRQAPRAERSS